VLQEGVSNHRHKSVTVKTVPGPSLEVMETEFLFQLQMRLLADPSRRDVHRLVFGDFAAIS